MRALLLTIKNVTEKVDRYEMIAVAADYHAELQDFNFNSKDSTQSWLEAKIEIDNALQNNREFFRHLISLKE